MLLHDLIDSAEADKHFNKSILLYSEEDGAAYMSTFRQLETEGKIALEECRVDDSNWVKLIRARGYVM